MLLTERLRLMPCPPEVAAAVGQGSREVGDRILGAVIPPEWPDADLRDFLPAYAALLAKDPDGARWGIWVMIEQQAGTVIGDIGFKGAPDGDGQVEIGYSVLPAWRRNGYAFEAAAALTAWALSQPDVRAVLAECLPDNSGSVRVLEKLGMERTGMVADLVGWVLRKAT